MFCSFGQPRVSNMFDAGMRTTLAQRLESIVSSVFDQTCFNRLATHFNKSMFGQQTMFDGVWSPNIYRLSRPLHCDNTRQEFLHFSRVLKCPRCFRRVFSTFPSRTFSNTRRVSSQCNTRLRLLHLLYDIYSTLAKQ